MGLNAISKKDLENFKGYILVEKNFSQHTARAYCADVLSYLIWLGDDNCENADFSKVREYLHFMRKYDYKKTTIARKIASIRTFYKFLFRENKIETNPAQNLISPKRPRPLPKFLSTDEVEEILNNINIGTPAGYRNRAILELLWASGMRISEKDTPIRRAFPAIENPEQEQAIAAFAETICSKKLTPEDITQILNTAIAYADFCDKKNP